MLVTTLLLLLSASPSPGPTFLLDDSPRQIRLVADEEEPGPQAHSRLGFEYEGWSRSQLSAEYDRLESIRPGIGLPIALTAGGAGALAFSALVLVSTLGSYGGSIAVVIFFAIAAVLGAGVGTLGSILLYRAVPERRSIGNQMDEVERRYREMRRNPEREDPPNAPDQDRAPVGPPAPFIPPPQVMGPMASPLTLAVF